MSTGHERLNPVEPGPPGLLDRLRNAWNAGDASAYAELFTEDATYVIWRGDILTGRSEIHRAHHDLFTRAPSQTRVHAVDTRLLDDHTAVVVTIAGTGDEGSISVDKLQTLVMVRREQGWMITAFHNTAMSNRAKQSYRTD